MENARSLRVSFLLEDSKATPSMTNSRVALVGKDSLDKPLDTEPLKGLALFVRARLTDFLCDIAGFMYFLLAIPELT